MKPEWRTQAVVAMCRQMLDTGVFDVLPILADALEDAGCDDATLLAECRDDRDPKYVSRTLQRRLVNLVYSEETAAAVRWLEEFAGTVEQDYGEGDYEYHNYASIIEVGREAVAQGSYCFSTTAAPDHFQGSAKTEFFRNWALATGNPVPGGASADDADDADDYEDDDGIYFRCAC